MQALTPIPLTAGESFTIPLNSQAGGSPQAIQGVILNNQSGYTLVTSGSNGTHTIPPWVNDFVPVTSAYTELAVTTSADTTGNVGSPDLLVDLVFTSEPTPVGYPTANPLGVAGAFSLVSDTILDEAVADFRSAVSLPAIPTNCLSIAVWTSLSPFPNPNPSFLIGDWTPFGGGFDNKSYATGGSSVWQVHYFDVIPGSVAGSQFSMVPPGGWAGPAPGNIIVFAYSVPAAMVRDRKYKTPTVPFSNVLNLSSVTLSPTLSGQDLFLELDPHITVVNGTGGSPTLTFTDVATGVIFAEIVLPTSSFGTPQVQVPKFRAIEGVTISSSGVAGVLRVSGAYKILPVNGAGIED